MRPLVRQLGGVRPRTVLVLVVALLAVGLGSLVQGIGCNQRAHYALVRALADGTSIVDEYQPMSCDLSYTDGHFYAAKAPGLAFTTLPAYEALATLGVLPEEHRNVVWLLGLLGALTPALAAAAMAALLAERVAPRTGLLVGVTLLVGTLLLPFATLFFAHALAAALAVAAFLVVSGGRLGAGSALGAGVLTGLAATVEHPAALTALPLATFALHRGGVRGLGYLLGCLAGFLPTLAYNLWSFGSPFRFAVQDAVVVPGETGHDVVGAVDSGFFGAVAPSFQVLVELLVSAKGLLTMSPVLAPALVGLVLLARRGHRAEAAAAAGVVGVYLVWNAGLTTPFGGPFGGDTPGPRYLVPAVPFLAQGLALAYRHAFYPTLALAGASTLFFSLATLTEPMLGHFRTRQWAEFAYDRYLTATVVDLHAERGTLVGILPFVLCVGAGIALAVAFAPRPPLSWRAVVAGAAAVAAWGTVALLAPRALAEGRPLLALGVLVLAAGGAALVTVNALRVPPG